MKPLHRYEFVIEEYHPVYFRFGSVEKPFPRETRKTAEYRNTDTILASTHPRRPWGKQLRQEEVKRISFLDDEQPNNRLLNSA